MQTADDTKDYVSEDRTSRQESVDNKGLPRHEAWYAELNGQAWYAEYYKNLQLGMTHPRPTWCDNP